MLILRMESVKVMEFDTLTDSPTSDVAVSLWESGQLAILSHVEAVAVRDWFNRHVQSGV